MVPTTSDIIREQFRSMLGDVTIEVREVDSIPRERPGKLRQFLSHVSTT
jgi:hypothetical protein